MAKLETTASNGEPAGERFIEIVADHRDQGVAVEPLTKAVDHGFGEINRDRPGAGMDEVHQADQAPVAAAEIEDVGNRVSEAFEQRRFTFSPMRNRVGLLQVCERVLRQPPQVGVPGVHVFHGHSVNAIDDPTGTIAVIYERPLLP
jgi:hypothetical protein